MTLTLSLAYMTVLAHQRNRESQAEALRAQAAVLNALSAGPAEPAISLPPTRAERAALARANLVGSAKDRWNAEIESAVRWAQTKDWGEVREGVEVASGRLWRAAFGGEAEQAARTAEAGVAKTATATATAAAAGQRKADEAVGSVGAAARSALEETRPHVARAPAAAEDRAAEAKATAGGLVQRGIERGKEMVGRAKAAAGLAEEKDGAAAAAAAAAASATNAELPGLSPVEKALQQRYERSNPMSKSVEEVLDERYKPIGQRDNTVLRGL